jgi:hypothetical protein
MCASGTVQIVQLTIDDACIMVDTKCTCMHIQQLKHYSAQKEI